MAAAMTRAWGTFTGALVCLVLLSATSARAGSLGGTVRNEAGAGIADIQVTMWTEEPAEKRWIVVGSATSNGSGVYTFGDVTAGFYRLHARMAPGLVGNYADRWYDVDQPTGDGYVGADADIIEMGQSDVLTGYDFTLPVVGGANGYVTDAAGAPLSGMLVRIERASDPRIHHNDETQGPCCTGNPHWGRVYFRGLPPAADYRVLVHDLEANYVTAVLPGLVTIDSGVTGTLSTIVLSSSVTNAYEPNGTFDAAQAGSVDGGALHADPPQAWSSSNAVIFPRGSDVDWYCFDALQGDRLLLTARTTITAGGIDRESPWVDPILALYSGDGETRLATDDDSGPAAREAFLDTAPITADQRLCAVVSTFGDTDWTGAGQGSAGAYSLTIEMGNRLPILGVSVGPDIVPRPPASVSMAEDASIQFDIVYDDPDGDELAPAVRHEDNAGTLFWDGPLDTAGPSGATYSWSTNETSAAGSPFLLTFSVDDGEFEVEVPVVLVVQGINQAPTTPIQLQPADGASVETSRVSLVIENSTDADGDPLFYEFQGFYGGIQGEPVLTATVAEDASGETSWTTPPIPDDMTVQWRVRAHDGQVDNAYSPWTEHWTFRVNTDNNPPSPPHLVKPNDGEEVQLREPTLSIDNAVDPEGDVVVVVFQVARDPAFDDPVTESPPVPQETAGGTTSWTVDAPLDWGAAYYARAYAADDRGAASLFSNVNGFRVKVNQPPGPPVLGAPFDGECTDRVYDEVPESLTVASVDDPEREPVSLDLAIFSADDDPERDDPLLAITVPQNEDGSDTEISLAAAPLQPGGRYLLRIRSFDGTDYSEWTECEFGIEEPLPEPVEIAILSPEPGTVFPRGTEVVVVEVSNASDPVVQADEEMRVAYCASIDPNYSTCDPDPAAWLSVPQASMSPNDRTSFTLSGLEPGQQWWVKACGLRPDGHCGPPDTTEFSITTERATVTPGCSCDSTGLPAEDAPWMATLTLLILFARRRR